MVTVLLLSGITGILNALLAGARLTAATATSIEDLEMADYHKCIGALAHYPGMTPKWYVNKTVWGQLHDEVDGCGGGTLTST